jgi:hypothetical protein
MHSAAFKACAFKLILRIINDLMLEKPRVSKNCALFLFFFYFVTNYNDNSDSYIKLR